MSEAVKPKAKPRPRVKKNLNKLQQILSEDKQLTVDAERFQHFLSLAKFFEEDLAGNIMLSSFELDAKYSTYDPNGWVEFKAYAPVRAYIAKFVDEIQYTEANKILSQTGNKATDAIKVSERIEAARDSDKNTDIIVFLIPQRNYNVIE